MSLKALSYLGIRSDKLNDWSNFAGGLLGMQKLIRVASRWPSVWIARNSILTCRGGRELVFGPRDPVKPRAFFLVHLSLRLDGTPHSERVLICIPLHDPFNLGCRNKTPFAQGACHDV